MLASWVIIAPRWWKTERCGKKPRRMQKPKSSQKMVGAKKGRKTVGTRRRVGGSALNGRRLGALGSELGGMQVTLGWRSRAPRRSETQRSGRIGGGTLETVPPWTRCEVRGRDADERRGRDAFGGWWQRAVTPPSVNLMQSRCARGRGRKKPRKFRFSWSFFETFETADLEQEGSPD